MRQAVFKILSNSIYLTQQSNQISNSSLSLNNNCVNNPNLNISTSLTSNNSKLHSNQCPECAPSIQPYYNNITTDSNNII